MNKTDIVFGLSFVASEATLFTLLASGLVSHVILVWIGVVTGMLQLAAYTLYERFNGTVPPPIPPTTSA